MAYLNVRGAVLASALVYVFLVYTGICTVSSPDSFRAAFDTAALCRVEGTLLSGPVKSGGGRYSALLVPERAAGVLPDGTEVRSSAAGRLRVSLAAAEVEAHYPGRLYTEHAASQGGAGVLYEAGSQLVLEGTVRPDRSGSPVFYAQSAEFHGFGAGPGGAVAGFRARARLHFKRLLFRWGNAGGLLLALVSGSREYLAPELAAAFRLAGLSHLLALSGMHLSFFGSAARRIGAAAQLAAVLLFVWFAGVSPSLFRALLCLLLGMLCGGCFLRHARQLSVLAVSFIIHVHAFPADIQTAACILSYTALLGILLGAQPFLRLLVRVLPYRLAEAVAVSLAAQLLAAPVSAALFGTISPAAALASVAVSPLVTLFMATGSAAVLLGVAVPPLTAPLGAVMNAQYAVIDMLARLFAAVPQLTLQPISLR